MYRLQAVVVPKLTTAFLDIAVGHGTIWIIIEMTSCTVLADEDSKGHYAMSRLIFLAVYTIFVEWAFRHLLLKKFFKFL